MMKYRNIGLKLTPQRLEILAYLDGNKDHPSAEDVFKEVSKKFPTLSFATVYNTLETLKKKGYISELSIDPGKKRFDPNINPHCHLICIECKKIVDIFLEYKIELSEENKNGFEIIGNHIDFYGLCPECKQKKK